MSLWLFYEKKVALIHIIPASITAMTNGPEITGLIHTILANITAMTNNQGISDLIHSKHYRYAKWPRDK